MSKIFIIGLPRTGTTSISVAMLNFGFKVAHTAFTKQAFELADVISDAPCFSDFKQLDKIFPGSKFIYLQRELSLWVPSVKRLLIKMGPGLIPKSGHFSPVLKRSFIETFELERQDLLSDQHLTNCYCRHQQSVESYFKNRNDLLSIDLSDVNSFNQLVEFLALTIKVDQQFPHLNQGTQVAKWKSYKHENKVGSFSSGVDHRQFFDY
ncbi:sulfotransferase family protein [Psychromonas sp.]|nr:sulfotransferase family protein [Psychromonas sp.]